MPARDDFARKVAWAALGLAGACFAGVTPDAIKHTVAPVAALVIAWRFT